MNREGWRQALKSSGILCFGAALTACAQFSPREEPVVERHITDIGRGHVGVLSMTPERRNVIVKDLPGPDRPEAGAQQAQAQQKGASGAPLVYCAEPPPDVAESLGTNMRLAAEAAAKVPLASGQQIDASISGEFARALASSAFSTFRRSQGADLFRVGLYALCQERANGRLMSDADYLKEYRYLLDKVVQVIEKEIAVLPQQPLPSMPAPSPTLPPPSPPTGGGTIK